MLLLLAVLLTACNKYDIQPEQAEGFIKFFSSTLTETAYDVKETPDGGYVAIGTTSNEEGIRDLYLVKTDKFGNEESWSPKIIGGEYDDVGTSIQVETDGYIILGYSKQTDSTAFDMYLVKTDLQGDVIWERWAGVPTDIEGVLDDRGLSLQITFAGEYLAAGIRENSTLEINDFRVTRFDKNGNVVQNRAISPGGPASNAYIIETSDNFMLCGSILHEGKQKISVIPVEKDTHFGLNAKRFETTGGELYGNCIQELSDGNLLVCGTRMDLNSGLNSVYLNKLDPDAQAVWENPVTFSEIEDQASLTGMALRVIDDNSYVLIGTRNETGNEDILLLHTDANGNEMSRRILGDEGFQRGVSLEVTGGGGLILVGNNGAEDQSMMSLVKTDASGKL